MAKRVHQLTEAAVEKAKPVAFRREIPDGNGLYLIVHPSGLKSWAVRYRRDGIPKKLTLTGAYPAVDLKTARSLARKALQAVADGGDPAARKIHARRSAGDRERAYPAVADEFLRRHLTKKKQRPRARTLEELGRLLGMERDGDGWQARKGGIAERWRTKRVHEIAKADVLAVLDAMVARGIGANANRRRAALHLFFGWCFRRGLVAANPVAGIDRPVAESPRDRVLTDSELALFWKASGEDRLFGPMWRLLLLTAARRDEARNATWNEFDLDAALWTIPKTRTKNGREHTLPLPALAVDIVRSQPRIAGKAGLIFTTSGEGPLGGLSRAKTRLDKRMTALATERDPKAEILPWVIHDLRRTAATGIAKLGFPLPVIEKILNHTGGSFAGVVGVYQRHDFLPEMRAALDAWVRHIEAITTGTEAAVIPMRRRGG